MSAEVIEAAKAVVLDGSREEPARIVEACITAPASNPSSFKTRARPGIPSAVMGDGEGELAHSDSLRSRRGINIPSYVLPEVQGCPELGEGMGVSAKGRSP